MQDILDKIEQRRARVVVIGTGYVGLPLLIELAKAGFVVTGYDKDVEKVQMLARGESYIADIPSSALAPLVSAGKLTATSDPDVLAEADAVVVCVPTPLNKTKDPDMRFIASATEEIAARQHKGMLIVLESTTYPGTSREVLVPHLTQGGFVLGEDVFIAFSPERVDPGNKRYFTHNTPKVIGGATPGCLRVATALYQTIIETLVPVSSTDSAEMVKLLENTFRAAGSRRQMDGALQHRLLALRAARAAEEAVRAARRARGRQGDARRGGRLHEARHRPGQGRVLRRGERAR